MIVRAGWDPLAELARGAFALLIEVGPGKHPWPLSFRQRLERQGCRMSLGGGPQCSQAHRQGLIFPAQTVSVCRLALTQNSWGIICFLEAV